MSLKSKKLFEDSKCQLEWYINLRLLIVGLLVYAVKYGGVMGPYRIVLRNFVQYRIVSTIFSHSRIMPSLHIFG